jgi:putative glutamine amidotransferase
MKPIIGISLDHSTEQTFATRPWYALRCDYSNAVSAYGGVPIFLAHIEEHIEKYLDMIDGLLLPGCDNDIDPKFYGEEVKYPEVNPESLRAGFEMKLLNAAAKRMDIPVLGICNGMQLMNVFYGGSLIQHIPAEVESNILHKQDHPKNIPTHKIMIQKDTKLSNWSRGSELNVNSSHHQAVKRLGEGLVISAIAEDGVIEAIEDPKHRFMIGCEWHPEYLVDNGIDLEIFREFISASSEKHRGNK